MNFKRKMLSSFKKIPLTDFPELLVSGIVIKRKCSVFLFEKENVQGKSISENNSKISSNEKKIKSLENFENLL
jgi:hypothetical protein